MGDSTSSDATATVARSDAGSSNVGSGLPASARARMSLKVWPVPAKNFSARAGLIVTASFCPAVSSSAGSASVSEGWKRERIERSHGMSMFRGSVIDIVPTAPALLQVAPANGLVVGEQRSWNPGRTAGQEQDDLAAEVEAREVVVLRFGNAQTVAREDNRRLELRRRIHAHADRGFGAQRDRLGLAAANERETRLVFDVSAAT